MTKRLLDVLLSATGLLLLAPVLLICAVAIRVDSAGPVFFRQQRVGRHGSLFRICKFRTMVDHAGEPGTLVATATDRRITRVGRVLRRHKLDEIPQLFNVLAGDMSLVGPRPEVPKYVAMYSEDARRRILSVRPGITDDTSIEFLDEGEILARARDPEHTYVHELLPKKIRRYLAYVDSQSLWRDFRIIAATLRALIRRPAHRA